MKNAMNMNNYRNQVLNEMADRILTERGLRTIDLDHATDNIELGSGTFEMLARAYADGKISLLRNGDAIVGINYESGAATAAEDQIAGMRFTKKYTGINVTGYIDLLVRAQLAGKTITAIDETGAVEVIVTFNDGSTEAVPKHGLGGSTTRGGIDLRTEDPSYQWECSNDSRHPWERSNGDRPAMPWEPRDPMMRSDPPTVSLL